MNNCTCPKCGASWNASTDLVANGWPVCWDCEQIATRFNGSIFTDWQDSAVYQDNLREMNRQIDEAFDHRYFRDW